MRGKRQVACVRVRACVRGRACVRACENKSHAKTLPRARDSKSHAKTRRRRRRFLLRVLYDLPELPACQAFYSPSPAPPRRAPAVRWPLPRRALAVHLRTIFGAGGAAGAYPTVNPRKYPCATPLDLVRLRYYLLPCHICTVPLRLSSCALAVRLQISPHPPSCRFFPSLYSPPPQYDIPPF